MFKFNENEVYSAVDAELVMPGAVVAVANTFKELQTTPKIKTILYIKESHEPRRFVCEAYESWEYAQLIAKSDDPLWEQKRQEALKQINTPKFELLDHVIVEEHWEGMITAIKHEEGKCQYCCGGEWWQEDRLEKVEEEQC